MILKPVLFFALGCVSVYGIGFSTMGNVSTSLGGAGVALRDSAWGLYYNPALLSSDARSKFSFSGGGYVARKNLNEMLGFEYGSDQGKINTILSSLQDAQARLDTQFGVVAQIGGFYSKTTKAVPDEYGRLVTKIEENRTSAFAIGAFASSKTVVSFAQGSGSKYQASSFSLALMEVPLGYAYKLQSDYGDFNFGVAMKYMWAGFGEMQYQDSIYNGVNIELLDWSKLTPSHSFGLDLGFLYSIEDVDVGINIKNINFPSFQSQGQKITLNPEMRLGVAYKFANNYTLVSDIDLIPVEIDYLSKDKSLNMGFGVMGDYDFLDFRVGFQTDVFDFQQSRISAGINVFGILDIVGEMGFNFSYFSQADLFLPTNFGVKIGSTFSF